MQLVEAANAALVTPWLRRALVRAHRTIPEDARAFLTFIDHRNNMRNAKLRLMALDAVAALNAAGIEPVLLKGMAVWATCEPAAEHYPRMMSDVDLLIRPSEADAALAALPAAGFMVNERTGQEASHTVAEFWRAGDVGLLDLHTRMPGRAEHVALFDPDADTIPALWPGSARVPTASLQIYLTCLHDMFHDEGFWSGGFDVRHLCDIADLASAPQRVDWAALNDRLANPLLRNAIHSQLVAADRIAGAQVPDPIRRRVVPRLHHRRHRVQYARPKLNLLMLCLGLGLEAFHVKAAKGRGSIRARMAQLREPRDDPNKI